MAKATKKSTTWILLREAKARAVLALGSPEYAEDRLMEWLRAGKLHWRSNHQHGSKKESDPGSGDPEFFRPKYLLMDWNESWASAENGNCMFYVIQVVEDDLSSLLADAVVGTSPPR